MTPSDDLSPPRRPIFFPVVIATVFLTIIGMTGGFVLGNRHRDEEGVSTGPPDQTSSPAGISQSWIDQGAPCPDETRVKASELGFPGELRQILKIETKSESTVWICEDPQGSLYYQGKTGGFDADLVEGVNGLFLSQVERLSDGRFRATANEGNSFVVSRKQLEVHFADGRQTQVSKVVRAE